ncbi:unnamed protein product, partial [Pylaiella littoralis]
KLVVLNLGADPSLLSHTSDATRRRKLLSNAMYASMHLAGTVFAPIPQPWHHNLGIVHDAMESTGLRVEDHPLVLHYVSTRGGRP